MGNQLGSKKIKKVSLLKALPYAEAQPEAIENIDVEIEEVEDSAPQIKLDL